MATTAARFIVLLAIAQLVGCASDDTETTAVAAGPVCTGVVDKPALRAEFTATLFPEAANTPFFCALNFDAASCAPQGSHLSGVSPFTGAVPTEQTCRTTANLVTLGKCDAYAKQQITLALDEGNLTRLLAGVTRLGDVMKRPQVPAYYRWTNTTNKFVEWLTTAGIKQPHLTGACTTGTDDDRYYCLVASATAPGRATVRGLLELLHEHNGVLVRNGTLADAATREANIFRSATGAVNTFTARTTAVGARMGPGVQHVDYLATVFALRLLDGSVGAPGTETDALFAMPSYVPTGESATLYDAGLGVVQAQMGARAHARRIGSAETLDFQIARDLRNMFVTLRMTARAASGLAMCGVAQELAVSYGLMAGTNLSASSFNRPLIANMAGLAVIENFLGLPWLAGSWIAEIYDPQAVPGDPLAQTLGACNMHEQLVAYSFNETLEVELGYDPTVDPFVCTVGEEIVDPYGHSCEILDCLGAYCTDQTRCYWNAEVECPDQDTIYNNWIDFGDDLSPPLVVDEVLATVMTAPRVRAAYNALISSDDDDDQMAEANELYDRSGPDGVPDGQADLHHTLGNDAQVSILNAGVSFPDCMAELTKDSTDFSSGPIGALVCEPTGGVDADCGLNVAPNLGATFFPYAIASRVCPEFTAKVTGVYDDSFYHSGTCATPWTFTQAVEYFLERDALSHDVMIYTDVIDGRKELLAEFAAETLHLNQPAAAFYRHRADFVGVVGNAPVGTPNLQSYYNEHAGLTNVEAYLKDAERIMGQGIDLIAGFDALVVGSETGTQIIARTAAAGYTECTTGSCDDNDVDHAQAMFYRRLRDSIETYNRASTKLLEVQRRRLDGRMCFDWDQDGADDGCDSCIKDTLDGVLDVDTNGDGVLDADYMGDGVLECDPTDEIDGDNGTIDCADQCGYFDTAIAVVDVGSARMASLGDLLTRHRPLADPAVRAFVRNASSFAEGTGDQLTLAWREALSGVDWLGYKVGLWYPGIHIDPALGTLDTTAQLTEALTALEASASIDGDQFDGYIDDYLDRITQLADWNDAVGDQNQVEGDATAAYCGGGPEVCDSEWSEDSIGYDVNQINELMEMFICERTIELWTADFAEKQEFVIGIPAVDCPNHFISPDLQQILILGVSGYIPEQAAVMKATLTRIETQITEVNAYYDKLVADNELAHVNGVALMHMAALEDQLAGESEAISCLGAMAGMVGFGFVTGGSSSGSFNFGGVVTACGHAISETNGLAPGQMVLSPVDAQRIANEYVMGLQVNSTQYELATMMLGFVVSASDYGVHVTHMQSLEASLDRLAAYGDTVLDNLIDTPLLDPSLQLFEETTLGQLDHKFTDFAKAARDVHHLIQYDLGQSVREGGTFVSSAATKYYLPRLSELTIFRSYSGGFLTAYHDLESSDGTRSNVGDGEAAFNLVAYASLLAQIHGTFNDIYSDRQSWGEPLYIGSAGSGMPATDTDGDGMVTAIDRSDDLALYSNPGEWAMLADSPFFNPNDYVDIDTDLNPLNDANHCAAGEIDLRDYCRTWSRIDGEGNTVATTVKVPEDSCLRVAGLPVPERYNLAQLEHMTHGVGVTPFACFRDHEASVCIDFDAEANLCVEWGVVLGNYIAVARDDGEFFTYAELGGTDGVPFASDASDQGYYNAQTRVVKNILDRFRHEYQLRPELGPYELNVQPGNFLFLLNMSKGAESDQGYTTASFDPEYLNLLYNTSVPIAAETIAEQITSMALICTDSTSCPNSGTIGAQAVWMGPVYQGDRCVMRSDSSFQERVRFEMDPRVIDLNARQVVAPDPNSLDDQVMAILQDPVYTDTFGAEPVHASSLIISVLAHANGNGAEIEDGFGQPLPWSLYRSSSPLPRLRPAIDFTYRKKFNSGDFAYSTKSVLRCEATEDVVTVR